ncbi:hypothetical protein HOY80DRAFT_878106, partial [Tuber brumale]
KGQLEDREPRVEFTNSQNRRYGPLNCIFDSNADIIFSMGETHFMVTYVYSSLNTRIPDTCSATSTSTATASTTVNIPAWCDRCAKAAQCVAPLAS